MRIILALALLFALTSCEKSNSSSTPGEKVSAKKELKGKNKELKEQGIVSGVSKVTHADLATAMTTAQKEAEDKVQRNIKSKLKKVVKGYIGETEKNNEKMKAIEESVLPILQKKTRVIMERTRKLESGSTEVFVLIVLDPGTLLTTLDKEIKPETDLYMSWRNSATRKSLVEDVQSYDQWKIDNTPKPEEESSSQD